MAFLLDLWLPILLSGVLVFVASSLFHILSTHHKSDYAGLPDEGAVAGLKDVEPGNYMVPHAVSFQAMKESDWGERLKNGPVAVINLRPKGQTGMGSALWQWFAYSLLVGVFCAYLGSLSLTAEAEYFDKFQITSTVAFLGYAFLGFQEATWKGGKWSTAFKFMFDGTVYALLTGGTFAGLWPGA
ncbi:MAG: hypothetical protein AAFZ65_06900 [Planctomycetota bacterium]